MEAKLLLEDDGSTASARFPAKQRDFADHLEEYLAKRDGVDKLLKITRYAAKLALASPYFAAGSPDLQRRLRSFESSVGVSRKAFRLGRFVQDINVLKRSSLGSRKGILVLLAHGGEGVYSFLDQFVWLAKAGLIDGRRTARIQAIGAWADLVGHVSRLVLKAMDLKAILEEMAGTESTVERLRSEGLRLEDEAREMVRLQVKALMRRLSIVQELADTLILIGDLQRGKGFLSNPVVVASLALLSAFISTHKNWTSC
ncbi:peroxisomal membrane protein 11A-like [Nymphaea colorata]|uniref:Peroxisomal membrane protein 11A n=1 Tax=Nymphaea colorata TaxID=210225 RepID=A0A5K1GMA9_9MAGN|nr:peroxisomal membrane protein 11A-like [Nymphaea colorata]